MGSWSRRAAALEPNSVEKCGRSPSSLHGVYIRWPLLAGTLKSPPALVDSLIKAMQCCWEQKGNFG